jgi:ATP-binding protein involved in chromosome partitioning
MAVALNERDIPHGPAPVAGVREIVLVGSGKGGVGKSTVAVNLAVALAQAGKRCGIVDLDLSGPSVARFLGTGAAPELGEDGLAIPRRCHGVQVISVADMIPPEQAVAWKGPLVAQAVEQLIREVAWDDLDILVADMPPGTGDVLLTVLEQIPVTGAVVVTTPERMATIDAERAVALFHEHDIPVFGILRNLAEYICPCCGERQPLFEPGDAADVARRKHVTDLGAIPADPGAARLAEGGTPMAAADPQGATGQAFAALAGRVCEAIERENAGMKRRLEGGRSIWELLDDG